MERGGSQQLCGAGGSSLAPAPLPLPCHVLATRREQMEEMLMGGSGSRSRCIQMAQAQAEAVPRPVAGVAVTWLTSVWHIWEGQPIPGQDSFSGLSCLQVTWCVYGKPVLKKNQKAMIDLLWRAGDRLLN